MKYVPHKEGGPGIEWTHGVVHVIWEWEQCLGKWSWKTWHLALLTLEYEQDIAIPGWEIIVILLGLGFRIRVNGDWTTTETGRALLQAKEEMKWETCPTCGYGKLNPNDAPHGPAEAAV